MCTLTIAYHVFEDAPIAVAANRDEMLDRPASPPSKLDIDPPVIAPLDEQAGGTWIGINDEGVFVGITNRWVDRALETDRSRGLLVRDALSCVTAEDAARAVERELDQRQYDGFNLVIADRNAAIVFEWDGHLQVANLTPGIHVVMNAGFDDRFSETDTHPGEGRRQGENARRVRLALQPDPDESVEAWIDRAAEILRDHDYGVCLHPVGSDAPDAVQLAPNYGTRSSSLIILYADGTSLYQFADGPPCRTQYEPIKDHF